MWGVIIPVVLFSIIFVGVGVIAYTMYAILEELKK